MSRSPTGAGPVVRPVTGATPHWSRLEVAGTLDRPVGGRGYPSLGVVVRIISNGARVASTTIVVALAVAVLCLAPGAAAAAQTETTVAPADPTATDPAVTDPAATDPAAGDPSATTAPAGATPQASVPGASDDAGGDNDAGTSRRLMAVIGALLGVAFLLTVLTFLYWRHTRPSRRLAAAEAEREWVEGEGWVTPAPAETPDPIKAQKRLRRKRRAAEHPGAAPVEEWFAEPDPTLDPFAADAVEAWREQPEYVGPEAAPAAPPPPPAPSAPPPPPARRRRPAARAEGSPNGNGDGRPAGPRRADAPGADGRPAGPRRADAPGADGRPAGPRRADAPAADGGSPPRRRPAPRPSPAEEGAPPPARRQRPVRPVADDAAPADAGPAPEGPPRARRRPSAAPGRAGPGPGPDADAAPAPDPEPISEDWDAQTDELAEFWQEMRNRDG